MDVYQKDKLYLPGSHFGLDQDGRNILDRMFETTAARHLSDEEISIRLTNAGLSTSATSAVPPPGENS